MHRVATHGVRGRSLRVWVLGDIDLLPCAVYCVASVAAVVAMRVVVFVLSLPAIALARVLALVGLDVTRMVFLLPLALPLALVATLEGGKRSGLDLVASVGLLVVATAVMLFFGSVNLYDPATSRPRRFGAARHVDRLLDRAAREADALPESYVKQALTRRQIYLDWMRVAHVVPAFGFMVLAPRGSYLHLACMAWVVLFVGINDFEMLEHIASHSRNGRCTSESRRPLVPVVLEVVRRYLVWPLGGFFPGQYSLTHGIHHHTENNGPADYQSLLRFDRTSVLDFAKAVTWFGLVSMVNFDSIYYFVQRGKRREARRLALSYVSGYAVIGALAIVEPWFVVTSLAVRFVLSGAFGYLFAFKWHAFHSPDHVDDVEASNNAVGHYIHHKRPNALHLWDHDGLESHLSGLPADLPIYVLAPEASSGLGLAYLIGLLWTKDLESLTKLLTQFGEFLYQRNVRARPENTAPAPRLELEKLTTLLQPAPLQTRASFLRRLDDALCAALGSGLVHASMRRDSRWARVA